MSPAGQFNGLHKTCRLHTSAFLVKRFNSFICRIYSGNYTHKQHILTQPEMIKLTTVHPKDNISSSKRGQSGGASLPVAFTYLYCLLHTVICRWHKLTIKVSHKLESMILCYSPCNNKNITQALISVTVCPCNTLLSAVYIYYSRQTI